MPVRHQLLSPNGGKQTRRKSDGREHVHALARPQGDPQGSGVPAGGRADPACSARDVADIGDKTLAGQSPRGFPPNLRPPTS